MINKAMFEKVNIRTAYPLFLKVINKGGSSLLDQGLFAGTNFIFNILLARWMTQSEFGAFTLVYSIFLLIGSTHSAVLSEPLLVYGSKNKQNSFKEYVGSLEVLNLVFCSLISLVILIVGCLNKNFASGELYSNLIGLAIATPFILFQWLTRRVFYAQLKPELAAIGSGLYLFLLLGGLFLLNTLHLISSLNVWLVYGIAGLIVSLWSNFLIQPQVNRPKFIEDLRQTVIEHWNFGSWNLVGTAIYWLSGQVILVVAPAMLGLAAAANIAAALNLFRPLNPLMQSVTSVALPTISKSIGNKENHRSLIKKIIILTGSIAGFFFLYGMCVTVFSAPITGLLYGGKYDNLFPMIFLFTFSYMASSIVSMLTTVLKAAEQVKDLVRIWAISAFFTLLLTFPMMLWLQSVGAVLTLVISYSIAAITAVFYINKNLLA